MFNDLKNDEPRNTRILSTAGIRHAFVIGRVVITA